MSGSDIFWIAVGFFLAWIAAAAIGAFAGGYAIIKVLFKMHENSLPRKD